jgi:protein TonB
MRAGMALSAAGHAALVSLAVWALPWLRVRPEPPVPAVAVSFVSEADLAALARRAAEAKAPAPPPTAAPPVAKPAALAPRFEAPAEPEPPLPVPEEIDLAPGFDTASPLGLSAPAGTPAAPPQGPRARPDGLDPFTDGDLVDEEPPADLAVARERHLASLQAAVLRARIYPPAARGRGLIGVARLYLVVARDGTLIEVRLMASSGSATLDRAAVEAARRARWPSAPDGLPGESFGFVQDLSFDLR